MKQIFEGIYEENGRIYTINLVPGRKVYGEPLVTKNGKEYRNWDPTRSKLAAAIIKGLKEVPIRKGDKVLYLGAASGTTSSHISDIVGEEGIVYCIEFSERAMRDLLSVCSARGNMVPIHKDARLMGYDIEKVDIVYCDIAQPDQTPVAIRNVREYLKPNGYLFLVIKSRSIDVVKSPRAVYEQEADKLKDEGFRTIDSKVLDPFEKDHALILSKPSDKS